MNKIERKYRKHFKTQEDWESYQRVRKARNKREQRERDKEKTKITQFVQQKIEQILFKFKNYTFSKNKSIFRRYREGIYKALANIDFNEFITLTCKNTIS